MKKTVSSYIKRFSRKFIALILALALAFIVWLGAVVLNYYTHVNDEVHTEVSNADF